MSKKIVILNGSPRAGGNTNALISAFKEGAESAGNMVNVFDLQKMNIHPCMDCDGSKAAGSIYVRKVRSPGTE